jgi:S1-C subfamily serine protease
LAHSEARNLKAGEREIGVPCICCSIELVANEEVAICLACGGVHHARCWEQSGGCRSYECCGESGTTSTSVIPLVISHEELATATPLVSTKPSFQSDADRSADMKRKWNRASVWAFAIALLGIPLFGLITGLVAIVVACIALVTHHESRRGFPLAVAAMLIGLADVVGWAVVLSQHWSTGVAAVSMNDMSIDPISLEELPAYLARAMRANVLIEVNSGLLSGGIGSGVVLKITSENAYIVTNRHVVDHSYSDRTKSDVDGLSKLGPIIVRTVSQIAKPGVVEWVAPHGVDLAIISSPLTENDVQEARWDQKDKAHLGEPVFAVGNPHGLGWTHTSGSISQLRRQTKENFNYRVLQTSAAINPGNSGGGLYDSDGNLLGINTLTTEKRFAEGLGFAISFETLLELLPDHFGILKSNGVDSEVAAP